MSNTDGIVKIIHLLRFSIWYDFRDGIQVAYGHLDDGPNFSSCESAQECVHHGG